MYKNNNVEYNIVINEYSQIMLLYKDNFVTPLLTWVFPTYNNTSFMKNVLHIHFIILDTIFVLQE